MTIEYDEISEAWYIYDGNGTKASANGTWLFIQKSYKITRNIKFRIENSLFSIEIDRNHK